MSQVVESHHVCNVMQCHAMPCHVMLPCLPWVSIQSLFFPFPFFTWTPPFTNSHMRRYPRLQMGIGDMDALGRERQRHTHKKQNQDKANEAGTTRH